ncbi:hypothetical protein ACIQC7_08810 [Kitasatospora sp. NPDC088556]|uniref:hypothetical protein n=1 Tax=Kitasatospora sp. NPDC088556 TaxID=3364076 RepID=UPI00380D201C
MSMIKRYMDDSVIVRDAAEWIAQMTDATERGMALTVLFQECGRMAQAYPKPEGAAKVLVDDVVEAFQAERECVEILVNLEMVA